MHSNLPHVRDDLAGAHETAWRRIGRAGTWFDSHTRVAIAAEARHAPACSLCERRKSSLSPYSITGQHDGLVGLPERVIEQIHRIVTDPGRLTLRWVESLIASGMADTEYVEVVAVAATVVSIDTFCRSIGQTTFKLPAPEAGSPTRRRPATAHQRGEAWLPMIYPSDLQGDLQTEEERTLAAYWLGARNKPPRALSLVPEEAYAWFQLIEAQYVPLRVIRNRFLRLKQHRAITQAQVELIASRVSILNRCAFCAPIHRRFLREAGGGEVEAYDPNRTANGSDEGAVANGGLLVAFTDAVLGADDRELAATGSELRMVMGDAAFVDAAAVAAAFNSINRVVNAIGLRLGQRPIGGRTF